MVLAQSAAATRRRRTHAHCGRQAGGRGGGKALRAPGSHPASTPSAHLPLPLLLPKALQSSSFRAASPPAGKVDGEVECSEQRRGSFPAAINAAQGLGVRAAATPSRHARVRLAQCPAACAPPRGCARCHPSRRACSNATAACTRRSLSSRAHVLWRLMRRKHRQPRCAAAGRGSCRDQAVHAAHAAHARALVLAQVHLPTHGALAAGALSSSKHVARIWTHQRLQHLHSKLRLVQPERDTAHVRLQRPWGACWDVGRLGLGLAVAGPRCRPASQHLRRSPPALPTVACTARHSSTGPPCAPVPAPPSAAFHAPLCCSPLHLLQTRLQTARQPTAWCCAALLPRQQRRRAWRQRPPPAAPPPQQAFWGRHWALEKSHRAGTSCAGSVAAPPRPLPLQWAPARTPGDGQAFRARALGEPGGGGASGAALADYRRRSPMGQSMH